LNKISSYLRESFKDIYLLIFFALLAGFFNPLISGSSFNDLIFGILDLILGVVGGVLLYKSMTSEKGQIIYFGAGFGLIFLSLVLIFQITGRI